MKSVEEFLEGWPAYVEPSIRMHIVALIKAVQADARAEIEKRNLAPAFEIITKLQSERDALKEQLVRLLDYQVKATNQINLLTQERETWGNEFNAVMILKEQLEKAEAKLKSVNEVHNTFLSSKCVRCEAKADHIINLTYALYKAEDPAAAKFQEERDAYRESIQSDIDDCGECGYEDFDPCPFCCPKRKLLARFPKDRAEKMEGNSPAKTVGEE